MDIILLMIVAATILAICMVVTSKVADFRKKKAAELATQILDSSLFISVDEVQNILLVFDAVTNKFLAQGTADDIFSYFNDKFASKNVYLKAKNGSVVLIKPAKIVEN